MQDTARENAYIKWVPEAASEVKDKAVWVAWLVRDIVDDLGTRTQFLAYLGGRPHVTTDLQFEISELYPNLEVDWEGIQQSLESRRPQTDVDCLSDDEIALRFRELAHEQGMSVQDVASRVHIEPRNILQETETLVLTEGNRERFEQASGSVFAYLAENHPEYAYGVMKVRLFLQGDHSLLERLVAGEPTGFSSDATRRRRAHWTTSLLMHMEASSKNAD